MTVAYHKCTRATVPTYREPAGATIRPSRDHPVARGFSRRFVEYAPSADDLALGELIERVRPAALREFDQIPMCTPDLLRQVWAMAPILARRTVAFVGDSDATSLLLGVLAAR